MNLEMRTVALWGESSKNRVDSDDEAGIIRVLPILSLLTLGPGPLTLRPGVRAPWSLLKGVGSLTGARHLVEFKTDL
jgi:hypothetical protein